MATFAGSSVAKSETSVTSLAAPVPAGAVSDLLIVTGLWGGGPSIPVLPAGFTSFQSSDTLGLRFNMGWKLATADEPAEYTVTNANAYLCVVSMLRISGWDTADPIPDIVHVTGSSATPISPGITPTADGLLVHVHMGGGDMYTGAFVEDSGYPAGDTGAFLRAAVIANTVANRGMGISWRAASEGVAVSDVTWDTGATTSATYRGISFVVASAPSTGQTIVLGSVSEADAVGAIEIQGGEPIPVPVSPPPVESDHVIARDLTTGFDLYLKDADTQFTFVASTAKLLTSAVLMDHKADVLTTETVTVIADDIVGGTLAGLQAGDVLTWEDLLYCVYLPSGNDACETLARVLGDWLFAEGLASFAGRAGFMEAMNAKAASLGMASSSFESPHGVRANPAGTDDDVNVTTARDMALAIEAAFLDPVIQTIAGAVSRDVTITGPNARTLSLSHTVELIDGPFNAPAGIRDEGVLASKTGGTEYGDNNLVSLWQAPNGHHIAIGTWGANTDGNRYLDNRAIMYGLLRDFPDLDVPPAADPDYDKVVFLAGFESGIFDESSYARTLTNAGAALTTTDPLIGSQSLETFGGTTRVQTADAPELHFGADDFAIEVWFRGKGAVPTDHSVLVSQYDTNSKRSWSLQYDVTNQQLIFWHSTDGVNAFGANFKFADFGITPAVFFNGAPRHVMARRAGGEIALYMNGEKGGQPYTVGTASLYDTDVPMMIGARASGTGVQYPLAGVFDEVRISKVARQTAPKYTAYGRAFPRTAVVAETTVLLPSVAEAADVAAVVAAKTVTLGAVSDSTSTIAPIVTKAPDLAPVTSANTVQPITVAKAAALVPVTSEDTASSVSASATAHLAAMAESDVGNAVVVEKAYSLALASETVVTGTLSADKVAELGAAVETDTPGAIMAADVQLMPTVKSWSIYQSPDDNVTSAPVAKPAGTVEGNTLLLTVNWGGPQTVALPLGIPAGFTKIHNDQNTYIQFGVWYKLAGASEPASYTVTSKYAGECVVSLLRISDFDPARPIANYTYLTGVDATPESPAIVPEANGLLLHIHAGASTHYTNLVPDSGYPPGDTGLFLRRSQGPQFWRGQGIAYREAEAGVAVPQVDWTTGATSGTQYRGLSLVIPSAPSGQTLDSVSETDVLGALMAAKTITLGSVTDSAITEAPVIAKATALGAVTDSVSAKVPVLTKVTALGAVGETDLSAALSIGILLDIAPATETDHAGVLQVGTNVVLMLSPVVETDQVGVLALGKAVALGSVAEAAQARAAGINKSAALGSTAEADLFGDLVASKAVAVAAVGEASLSVPIAATKAVTLEWVVELDVAGTISGTPIVLRLVSVSVTPALSAGVSIGPAISGKLS